MNFYNKKYKELMLLLTDYYSLSESDLLGRSRKARIAEARQVFAFCLREKFHLSFPAIGNILNRDHTTALHSYRKIEINRLTNERIKSFLVKCVDIEKNEDVANDICGIINKKLISVEDKKYKIEDLLDYIKSKKIFEEEEYQKSLNDFKEQRDHLIDRHKKDYQEKVNSIKEKKERQKIEYRETMKYLRKGDFVRAEKYLSPKKELLKEHNLENNIKLFLPKFENKTKNFRLPIEYNDNYLIFTFNKIEARTRSLIIDRYGFFNKKFSTLHEIADSIGVSRERVRQILKSGINEIYKNNYGGTRQIIKKLAKQILENDLVDIESFIDEIYIYNKKDRTNIIKFIFMIVSLVSWIKEFELSGRKYFINNQNEKIVLDYIDQIKYLIEKSSDGMPDLVEDKWDYILRNLEMYEFFQEKKYLFNKNFLRACYDNYLFESEITIFKNENSKKYDIKKAKFKYKIDGVPDEYKIFFK